ncbi:MAG: hypothetical protein EBY32_08260 [Proteobacteria bacterium]|nr:hypothetical protein [Pseudomonadota bacterium]
MKISVLSIIFTSKLGKTNEKYFRRRAWHVRKNEHLSSQTSGAKAPHGLASGAPCSAVRKGSEARMRIFLSGGILGEMKFPADL